MKKFGKDPAVKKTLLRNYEKPITKDDLAVFESIPSSSKTSNKKISHEKDWKLDQPTICSSETLANYLNHTKNSLPPPLIVKDLETDKEELCNQITKKLNFHYNDRIYKNLVELNTSVQKPNKINQKPSKTKITLKRDLEPNIEDFCEDEKHDDVLPEIQILKPKVIRVRPIENGDLHKLVANFENL